MLVTDEFKHGTYCVSHATLDSDDQYSGYSSGLVSSCNGLLSRKGLIAGVTLFVMSPLYIVHAAEEVCIDYYTVGESKCQPAASTPIAVQNMSGEGRSVAPSSVQRQADPVEDYLANYGKPPREFVEFYLNPTSENAQKWVVAYQGILQRGQKLSKAWGEADELYKAASSNPERPQMLQPQSAKSVSSIPPTLQGAAGTRNESFGAFAPTEAGGNVSVGGVRKAPVGLTYYFSQSCPYCARLTPEISILSTEMIGKLELTCVDVTPLGVSSRPDEQFITSKLPCNWRLPQEGEVESVGVRQTPTLVIQKEGKPNVKLSGYVPLLQLRKYFE